jgi:hypothetical protein
MTHLPVPVRLELGWIGSGVPEKLNVAVRKPSVCGRNCTLFVQLLCVASVTPQVMVCTRKALGSAPVSPKLKFVCEPFGGAKKVPGHIAKRQRGRHHCHRLHTRTCKVHTRLHLIGRAHEAQRRRTRPVARGLNCMLIVELLCAASVPPLLQVLAGVI